MTISAIEKLVDYAASGFGAVAGSMLAPWIEKRKAKALLIKSKAYAKASQILTAGQSSIQGEITIDDEEIRGEITIGKEIQSRLIFQEKKRQSNITAVVKTAAAQLDNKETTDHDVDHDWVARFFNDVQDVTTPRMQKIWATILAGEVEKPGRTSLHTLEILKNMTQRDAQLFKKVATFVWDGFILSDEGYTKNILGFPLYNDFLTLQSYGLLTVGFGLQRVVKFQDETKPKPVIMGSMVFLISMGDDAESHQLDLPIYLLTPQGREMYDVIDVKIDEAYLRALARFMEDNGGFKLERAPLIKRAGGYIHHGDPTIIEPA